MVYQFLTDKEQIESDLINLFNWSNTVQWNYENMNLAKEFANFMTELWRIHPFREGNTRATSVFMHLFAKKRGLEFNGEILSRHPGYLRKALVLAAVEEAPEPEYLLIMLRDALHLAEGGELERKEGQLEKYRVIKQYDVSKYKQKSFDTNKNPYNNDD